MDTISVVSVMLIYSLAIGLVYHDYFYGVKVTKNDNYIWEDKNISDL